MDLIKHLERQRKFSEKAFGPGQRVDGILDHLTKEIEEVRENPGDISEWVDVVLLALDGAWRQGYTPGQIAAAVDLKMTINEQRDWPDWREQPEGKAIEHKK